MTAWYEHLGVFDLETTGVNTDTARIVTGYLGVLGPDGTPVSELDWVIDPGVEIPAAAAAVHGYTTERAADEGIDAASGVAEIVAAVAELFGAGTPVVAYNAPYDFTVLDREAKRYSIPPLKNPAPIVDPLVIDKALDRFRRGKRTLEVTAQHYKVVLDDAHNAGADAVAAGRVAQALAAAYPKELALSALELHEAQKRWSQEQAESYQAYRRRSDPGFTTSGQWPVR